LIRTRLFVSTVSTELASARRLVADTLRRLGFDTVTQDDFPTGHGELRAWLEQQIAGCEGVFQMVGSAYGREPPLSDAPGRPWPDPAFGRCSYTQFELLYAQRLRKRTWVIEVGPGCRRDREPAQLDLPPVRDGAPPHPDPAGYQAERRALQLAYVERLRAANHLRHRVDSDAELENRVLRLKDELAQLRARQERHQRRLGWGLGGVFATLLLVGGGLLWSNHWNTTTIVAQTAAQQQITTERIRAHLLTAVEDAYRRDLQAAETVADWQAREQQRQAAAAQRAAQVARIEDLAASFAAIEARGEASGVFTELTRILKEQGVDPALAYVAAKRVGILDQVRNRQAAARQRNRDDLQPLLTSAGLYAAKGEAEPARALYQEVLELEPEWPTALDGNLRFLIAQGDLAVVRGRLPDAGRDFAQAKALAERLAGLEPDNREWQHNLGMCLERIGNTKTAQGDLAGALADYGQSLATAERLAAADPSNADWQRDLAVSHYRLGKIADRQGCEDLLRQHWGEVLTIFAAMQQRGLHVSPEDLAGLEKIRARVQGAAR
jgi:tetratricopeptide (TPR) repeat protein